MNQIASDTRERTLLACRKGRADMSYSKPVKLYAIVKASCDPNARRLDVIVMMRFAGRTLILIDCWKRKEKTTPFGVILMRSQVLYRAAQVIDCWLLSERSRFQSNHSVPTPMAFACIVMRLWRLFLGGSHGKGCYMSRWLHAITHNIDDMQAS